MADRRPKAEKPVGSGNPNRINKLLTTTVKKDYANLSNMVMLSNLGFWWLALILTAPAALFLVRLFMIQHDCGHGAFFSAKAANDWVGRVIGVLTLTPYDYWRRTHAIHHATSGNLDDREFGEWDESDVRVRPNPKGNRPRYPFIIGEVDRRHGGLMRDSVRVVDTLQPGEDPVLTLSNFFAGLHLSMSRPIRVGDVAQAVVNALETPETIGLIGKDLLAKAKPNLRVVNVARGGIVDEDALAEAIRNGVVAGAALDVFAKEPTTESPLFELDSVVVTPHLGASTREAQDKAGDTIAEMVQLALAGEFVPYAVNVSAAEASETVRPFLPLAERLGRLFSSLAAGVPSTVELSYEGQLGDYDTRILTLSVLKGLFASASDEPVTYVNAPQLAKEHGVEIRETSTSTSVDYVNLITIRGGGHVLAGTLVGRRGDSRLTLVDDHTVDVPPSANMLVVRNDDRPGMIGLVGTALGEAKINIADMDVGRSPKPGSALMVLSTVEPAPDSLIESLRAAPGILSVHRLSSD